MIQDKVRVGRHEHRIKQNRYGAHEVMHGPLRGRQFSSRSELKAAMERHPHYNESLREDFAAPTNNVGAGNIKGTGGAGGEPGVTPKWMKKHKDTNATSPVMTPVQQRKTLAQFKQGK